MKTFQIWLVLFILSTLTANAQTLKWGDAIEAEKKTFSPLDLLGKTKDSYFLVMSESDKAYIQKYAFSSLKLTKSVELKNKLEKEDLNYEFSQMMGANLYAFFSTYSKKEQKSTMYVQSFDLDLEAKGDLKEVLSVGGRNKNESGDMSFVVSQDSSRLALVGVADFKDKDKQKINFRVFDANMNPLWDKNVELPYTDKMFEVSSYIVSNEGAVFILGKKYNNDKAKDRVGGVINYTYEVFIYNQGQAQAVKKSITLGGSQALSNIRMRFDNNNNSMVTVLGFYGNGKTGAAEGFFSISFDKDMNVSRKTQKPFTADFVSTFAKVSKKRGIDLSAFEVKNVILRTDGSMLVLAELSYIQYTRDRNGGESAPTYVDADFLFINLDKDYNVSWMAQVDKLQISTQGGGFSIGIGLGALTVMTSAKIRGDKLIIRGRHSFVSYTNGSDVHLIYNDNIQNKDLLSSIALQICCFILK